MEGGRAEKRGRADRNSLADFNHYIGYHLYVTSWYSWVPFHQPRYRKLVAVVSILFSHRIKLSYMNIVARSWYKGFKSFLSYFSIWQYTSKVTIDFLIYSALFSFFLYFYFLVFFELDTFKTHYKIFKKVIK